MQCNTSVKPNLRVSGFFSNRFETATYFAGSGRVYKYCKFSYGILPDSPASSSNSDNSYLQVRPNKKKQPSERTGRG